MSKVLLILGDGMRPDSLAACGHPLIERMKAEGSYSLDVETVFPSVTLPCHMSLFHSVTPQRHGILDNTYVPQVRPVKGLFETIIAAGKKTGISYNWEPLRDLSRPGGFTVSYFHSGYTEDGYELANKEITEKGLAILTEKQPDFLFIYLGLTDAVGHGKGWMTEEYIEAVRSTWDEIDRFMQVLPEDYTTIITADHGGHERTHGTTMDEDMKIPLFIKGGKAAPGKVIEGAGIIDIAPTITGILGIAPDHEWEGKDLLK